MVAQLRVAATVIFVSLGLSGCFKGNVAWDESTAGTGSTSSNTVIKPQTPTVRVLAPVEGHYILASELPLVISGVCSEVGQSVKLSGAVTATVNCAAGNWTFTASAGGFSAEGDYTIKVDHGSSLGTSATAVTRIIHKDTIPPASVVFTVPLAGTTPLQTIKLGAQTFKWTADSSVASVNAFRVQEYADANCAGVALTDKRVSAPQYDSRSLVSGDIVSIKVTAYDDAQNVSPTSVCSGGITATSVGTFSVTLGSGTGYTNQTPVPLAIVAPASAAKLCITESAVAPSTGAATCTGGIGAAGSGWSALPAPTSFAFATASEGTKKVNVWMADSQGNVLSSPATTSVVYDITPPLAVTFSLPAASAPVISKTFVSAAQHFSWGASSDAVGLNSSAPYIVKEYTTSNCSGTAVRTNPQATLLYDTPAAISNGNTVSISVTAQDRAGNVATTCSKAIQVITGSFVVQFNGGSPYTVTQMPTYVITAPASANKFCLSETVSATPANTTACGTGSWVATTSANFTLSAADGLKTIYGYMADDLGNIASATAATITLDTLAPVGVTGVGVLSASGSGDTAVDAFLVGSPAPLLKVRWTNSVSTDVSSYSVSVRNSADTADVCAAVLGSSGAANFSTCSLSVGTTYKAKIVTTDNAGNPTTSLFPFSVVAPTTLGITSSATLPLAATYPATITTNVTVSNAGPYPITLSSISAPVAPLSVIAGETTCAAGQVVAASSSCVIQVKFTTRGDETGSQNLDIPYVNYATTGPTATLAINFAGFPASSAVTATYPTSGLKWMDYFQTASPSASCAALGTVTDQSQCRHGGEYRTALAAAGMNDCTGVQATDTKDAFFWTCNPGTPISFVSSGLKPKKGLRDLLIDTGWAPISVEATLAGKVIYRSTNAPWWTNSLSLVPTHSFPFPMTNPGTIYVVPSTLTTGAGFNFGNNNVGLVVLNNSSGYSLSSASSVSNCNHNDGTVLPGTVQSPPGTISRRTQVCTGAYSYGWVEGLFAGPDPEYGILAVNSRFLRVHNSLFKGAINAGVNLKQANFSTVTDTLATNGAALGIYLYNSTGNLVSSSSATKNGSTTGHHGLQFDTVYNSRVQDFKASTNASAGIFLSASGNITVDNALVSDNGIGISVANGSMDVSIVRSNISSNSAGVSIDNAMQTHVVGSVVTNSGGEGIAVLNGSIGTILHSNTVANNGGSGVYLNGSGSPVSYSTVSNLLVAGNTTGLNVGSSTSYNDIVGISAIKNLGGVNITTPTGLSFYNYMRQAGNSTMCYSSLSTMLTPNTCTDSGADNSNTVLASAKSFALRTSAFPTTSVFSGTVTSDTFNSASSGVSAYGSVDWFNFANVFRAWSKVGTFLTTGTNGRCLPADTTCQMVDWRLSVASSAIGAASDGQLNSAPLSCGAVLLPLASAYSSIPTRNSGDTTQAYLANAIEVMGDKGQAGGGDDDGLCESGETCIYAPNYGAYQGEGAFSATVCNFNGFVASGNSFNGGRSISNINFKSYSTMGAP
jgi:parallel beta-helix repeat protein